MTTARLYVDGEAWEISGNVTDSFLPYSNTIEASRSGRVYATTEARARLVTVENIMADLDEFADVVAFFESCAASTTRFNVTVAFGEDCADGFTEYHYTGCLVSGEPEYSLFERRITSFEFAYEARVIKES